MNAKLEEQKKIGDTVTLGFNLDINTKPYTVKYSTAGSITLEGSAADIKKKLEVNPKTQIPQILFTVYQHVFSAIYVLGSVLDTPYPPPDLLHPMAEKIQIISSVTPSKAQPENSPSVPPQIQQPVAGGDNPSAAAPAKEQKENLK